MPNFAMSISPNRISLDAATSRRIFLLKLTESIAWMNNLTAAVICECNVAILPISIKTGLLTVSHIRFYFAPIDILISEKIFSHNSTKNNLYGFSLDFLDLAGFSLRVVAIKFLQYFHT